MMTRCVCTRLSRVLTTRAPSPATRARWMLAYAKVWNVPSCTNKVPGSGDAWVTASGSRRSAAATTCAGGCDGVGAAWVFNDAVRPGGGSSLCSTAPSGAVETSSFGAPGTASTAA